MNGCADNEERLLLYLDGELDLGEEEALLVHLEFCESCRSALARSRRVDRLIEENLESESSEEEAELFLNRVRGRLARPEPSRVPAPAAGKDRTRISSFPRLWIGAAAAAAMLFLLFTFHEVTSRKDAGEVEPIGKVASVAETVEDKETSLPAVGEEESRRARDELVAILVDLDPVPEEDLISCFDRAVAPLREDKWRVEYMLSGVLKRETGPALLAAMRLATRIEGFKTTPGVITTLIRLLKDGVHPEETMKTLAELDGARAEAALGRALLDPAQRDFALTLLEEKGGEEAVLQITSALIEGDEFEGDQASLFGGAAIASLGRMGPEGVEGILRVFKHFGYTNEVVRGLEPVDPVFVGHLMDHLATARGTVRETGCRFVATLRLKEAVPYLLSLAEGGRVNGEMPFLLTLVGGAEAVNALVTLYEGPISLRERKKLAAALSEIFSLHPDELGQTLEEALVFMDIESQDVLIEMLSNYGSDDSCSALAWLVEHEPRAASSAALGLARTGSMEAFDRLMEMIRGERLSPGAQVAAAAAAFHLGGEGVLKEISGRMDKEKDRIKAQPKTEKSYEIRRASLTEARFKKLEEYIVQRSDS